MAIIYAIHCRENGMAYIGCTKSGRVKRFREHRCLLKQGKHKCIRLQEDWDKYGPDAFFVGQLEELYGHDSVESRRYAELRWMQRFSDSFRLYNEHIISFRPVEEARQRGVANAHREPGNRWTPEVNERRSKAQLGIPKGHGAKISATKRAKREQAMR